MPIQFDEATTASGLRYLILDISGVIDLDASRRIEAHLLPGQPHHLGYVLVRVAVGTEYSVDARKFLSSLQNQYTALGAVVTSPIGRAFINMMARFSQASGVLRMFMTEAEAVAWLESTRAQALIGRP
jgi:hypothetical protein